MEGTTRALGPWKPFEEMSRLRKARDRLLRGTFGRPFEFEEPVGVSFPLDVVEQDDSSEVKTSPPGLKSEDLDLTVSGNMLTIRDGSKEEREAAPANYLRRERRYGTFTRSITLRTTLDAEHTEARFENGILTLTVPKSAEARPKPIPVREQQAIGPGQQTQAS